MTGSAGDERTWTKRKNGGTVRIGLTVLSCEVRSGGIARTGASKYAATVAAGQIGLYAGTGGARIKIDDVEVLDTGRMKEIALSTFVEVGKALLAIRDVGLYRKVRPCASDLLRFPQCQVDRAGAVRLG